MNQQPIIAARNVSKAFNVTKGNISLRHEARSWLKSFFHKDEQNESFYALKNVSFSIFPGESVGIIGHNGAGKTTLLRILSRIMRPSEGHVEVRGSYVSLIGVGAGFSDTMTGRRNIYLNAAIHGINPDEIESKVDSIIEFADIGDYIDMPVKDYSSGMKSRLGFSVAIHILADIVFLDEVLAVGDVAFKRKSGEKLREYLSQNKTVILVSHSSSSITDICQRAIWLNGGEVRMDGDAETVVEAYEEFMKTRG